MPGEKSNIRDILRSIEIKKKKCQVFENCFLSITVVSQSRKLLIEIFNPLDHLVKEVSETYCCDIVFESYFLQGNRGLVKFSE